MTDLAELDFFTATTSPNLGAPDPRKHRHDWRWDGDGWHCARCSKPRDETAARRGRANRQRGKRIERTEMRRAGVHTGNANRADDGLSTDGMFALQAKSLASARFPSWMQLELDKLRVAHAGKVPVLLIAEAPGPGRKGRRLAVVEWADWLDLHGAQP